MEKLENLIVCIALILSLMFIEYRYIMRNIQVYIGENNVVYLEIFEQVDEYVADGFIEE